MPDDECKAIKKAQRKVRKEKKAAVQKEDQWKQATREKKEANTERPNSDLWPFQPRSSFERMMFSHAVWPLVHRKLHDGESYRAISEYLVDNVRDFVEFKTTTLLKYLHAIGRDMPSLVGKRIFATQIQILKEGDEIPEVDAKTLFNFCAAIQTERVMLGYEYEAKAGRLLQQTHQEIRLLGDIADGIAGLEKTGANSKLSLPADPGQNDQALQDTFKEKFGALVGGVISRPDARRRVLNAFQLIASRETGALKDIVEENDKHHGVVECSSETSREELNSSEAPSKSSDHPETQTSQIA
ncbi:MAG: hypothetical protein ACRCXD_17365 [Luteolibacter sp.]